MTKLSYECDNDDFLETKEFKTKDDALAYAKRKYFNPNDEWYDDAKEDLMMDYEVSSIQEVCDIDFKEFYKNNKFDFNDGRYVNSDTTSSVKSIKHCNNIYN